MRHASYLVCRKNLQTRSRHWCVIGLVVTLAAMGLLLVLLFVTVLHFARMNKLMRESKLAEPLEGQVGFYYTLWIDGTYMYHHGDMFYFDARTNPSVFYKFTNGLNLINLERILVFWYSYVGLRTFRTYASGVLRKLPRSKYCPPRFRMSYWNISLPRDHQICVSLALSRYLCYLGLHMVM